MPCVFSLVLHVELGDRDMFQPIPFLTFRPMHGRIPRSRGIDPMEMVAIIIGVNKVKDGLGRRPPVISKTKVACFTKNNMIQKCNADDFCALAKPLG